MPLLLGIVIAVAGVVTLSHIAPFPFLFDAAAGQRTLWRMTQRPGQRQIFLTFDDGPNAVITPELLDLLAAENVKATFFLIPGHLTAETAPIVRRIFAEGHGVGIHSANRWQMLRSPNALAAELESQAARIEAIAGRRPCPLFRPHAGWRSIQMLAGLRRVNHRLVGWSWLSWDWVWFRKRTGERIASQVVANAAPGKIAVLHDGHHRDPRAERRYTLDAVPRIVSRLRAAGYTFAALCEPPPAP